MEFWDNILGVPIIAHRYVCMYLLCLYVCVSVCVCVCVCVKIYISKMEHINTSS